MRSPWTPVAALLTCLVGAVAAAQPPADRPTATVATVATAPVVDGDVMGEPAWLAAEALEVFWQTTPDESQPVSERTEVRILATAERRDDLLRLAFPQQPRVDEHARESIADRARHKRSRDRAIDASG